MQFRQCARIFSVHGVKMMENYTSLRDTGGVVVREVVGAAFPMLPDLAIISILGLVFSS